MQQVFRLGKRYQKSKLLCQVLVEILVLCFYFIYRALLMEQFPDFVGLPLAMIFVGVGALFFWLISRIYNWIGQKIYYEITDDALIAVSGNRRNVYRWKDFKSAGLARWDTMSPLAVEFQVAGKKVTLNQYTDGIFDLVESILPRIQSHAEISSALRSRIETMKDLY